MLQKRRIVVAVAKDYSLEVQNGRRQEAFPTAYECA